MITLGLDTTGAWCTAALVNDIGVLAAKSEKIGRGHAERLAPMVQEILRDAGQNPSAIDRIAVCTGPGSFTGLRVALSFAKGFALARKTPVIGLSAHDILAAQMDPEARKKLAIVIDAKRGEICWAGYDRGKCVSPATTLPAEIAKLAISEFGPDRIIGDGAARVGLNAVDLPVSGPVLAWLAADLSPGKHPPEAFYARGPDAKLPGGKTP